MHWYIIYANECSKHAAYYAGVSISISTLLNYLTDTIIIDILIIMLLILLKSQQIVKAKYKCLL